MGRPNVAPRRVCVVGGHDFADEAWLRDVLDRLYRRHPFEALVHGAAAGACRMADAWAVANGVSREAFPPEAPTVGALITRSVRMISSLDPAHDLVLAFPGHEGTLREVRLAMSRRVTVRFAQKRRRHVP